ncbi:MAG: MFS transporter [Streptosporangiaceae bacterium]|nr:MFS transporter [Streptosporangiaceae bacterium]MBV9857319.1 MFS transporter [Streptosporangiaceae bacterium]
MTGQNRGALRQRFGVLGERNYRLFFTGYTTSLVGAAMVPVALTFAVLQEGRPASDVGYVLAAETIPLVVLLLAGGVVGDRLSRRAVMISADLMRCVSELLLAALVITGSPPLWAFMVLAGVIGAGQAFFNPALTGLLPLIVSANRLQQANALKGLASSTGQIIGPAAAGLITAAGGPGWAIAIDGATYAVSALCLARVHLPAAAAPQPEGFVTQLAAGWTEFRSRTWLWVIVTQFSLFHLLVYAPFMVLGAVVAKTALGGAAAWGFILTAQGAGAILGGLAVLRVQPRRPLVTATLGTFAFAAPVALLALRAPTAAIAAAAAISGVGITVFAALWDTTLQRHVPAAVLSRVSAYDWLGSVGLVPLGYALTGPLASTLGVTGTLWLAAAWTVLGSATALAVPAVRQLRTTRVPRRETDDGRSSPPITGAHA